MDHRTALRKYTPLCFSNDKGEAFHCVIEGEIGRGGSCIVYEVSREADTGDSTLYRVKEYYPYSLSVTRDETGKLCPSDSDREAFFAGQERFRLDFSRTNRLFYSGSNYAAMTNPLDVFSLNGTVYLLSAYSSRKSLAVYQPESLKECVTLVKQVAFVLGQIHAQRYLYLDIKPDNVLVLDGYQKQVQLFDFDSLLPLKDLTISGGTLESSQKLSFSRGFAPIELVTGNRRRLGPHTDVYGVGALLFFLLFGKTPGSPDCEGDAVYDFSRLRYDYSKCDDRLFSALSEFFHNALAVYYADRYPGMAPVLESLDRIGKYADPLIPRVFSTPLTSITRAKFFYGREGDFAALDSLLSDPDTNCLFLSGMGGIGKSTLIREYLRNRRSSFDTVLYVHYRGSIEQTFVNDSDIEINTLHREEESETAGRYFDRKIGKLKELVRSTRSILVIDNFSGEADEDFRALLATDLKVVVVCRQAPFYENSREMKLSAIEDETALRNLFEGNLGRTLAEEEEDAFRQILESVGRHTLILELIAKQIANSHLQLSAAADLTRRFGFSSIAPEKVSYEKDRQQRYDSIGAILDALFEAGSLSAQKKSLLKVVSLLGDDGMDINLFQQMSKLPSKEELNELIREGWLSIHGDVLSMHPVIQEAVHRLGWPFESLTLAGRFLGSFYVAIRLESTKNNFPKKLKNELSAAGEKLLSGENEQAFPKNSPLNTDLLDCGKEEQALMKEVLKGEYAWVKDDSPADFALLLSLIFQSQELLRQGEQEPEILKTAEYQNLRFITVVNTPPYMEDYILTESAKIFSECETAPLRTKAANLQALPEANNPCTILQLYEKVTLIHADHERWEEAERTVEAAEKFAKRVNHNQAYALYYNLLSNYYDSLLDGFYISDKPEHRSLQKLLLEATDKTLRYAKKGISFDQDHLYENNLLAKATVYLRGDRGSQKEIRQMLDTAKSLIEENTSAYAEVRTTYYLVCGWYSVFLEEDEEAVDECVRKTRELSAVIIPTDMQQIEYTLGPCANLYYELGCHDKSMSLLYEGIRLCAKHLNTDSYARVRQDLYEHLLEVACAGERFELCPKILEYIDEENKDILEPENRMVVPEYILRYIKDHQ